MLVFFVQWLPCAVYAVWNSVNYNVPVLLIQFAITFTNVGGVLNCGVYFLIRPTSKLKKKKDFVSETECDTLVPNQYRLETRGSETTIGSEITSFRNCNGGERMGNT